MIDLFHSYSAAKERWRSVRTGWQGICSHKLGSNDGWHVTEAECYEALSRWDAADDDARKQAISATFGYSTDGPEFVEDFVTFLRGAAENDGFLVY